MLAGGSTGLATGPIGALVAGYEKATDRVVYGAGTAGFFAPTTHDPLEVVIRHGRLLVLNRSPKNRAGVLVSETSAGTKVTIRPAGDPLTYTLRVLRPGMAKEPIVVTRFNVRRGANRLVVFTRFYGTHTPTRDMDPPGIEIVVRKHTDASGATWYKVVDVKPSRGGTAIPSDGEGFVISLRGKAVEQYQAMFQVGDQIEEQLELPPAWKEAGMTHAFMTGPELLREGHVVVAATAVQEGIKGLSGSQRMALGVTKEGKLLLVWLRHRDGKTNISFHEAAGILKAMGAQQAVALDGGNSSALYARTPEGPLSKDGRDLPMILVIAGPPQTTVAAAPRAGLEEGAAAVDWRMRPANDVVRTLLGEYSKLDLDPGRKPRLLEQDAVRWLGPAFRPAIRRVIAQAYPELASSSRRAFLTTMTVGVAAGPTLGIWSRSREAALIVPQPSPLPITPQITAKQRAAQLYTYLETLRATASNADAPDRVLRFLLPSYDSQWRTLTEEARQTVVEQVAAQPPMTARQAWQRVQQLVEMNNRGVTFDADRVHQFLEGLNSRPFDASRYSVLHDGRRIRIPWEQIVALLLKETANFNARAVLTNDGHGVAQINRTTLRELWPVAQAHGLVTGELSDYTPEQLSELLFDPTRNVQLAILHLRALLARLHHRLDNEETRQRAALFAYNRGSGYLVGIDDALTGGLVGGAIAAAQAAGEPVLNWAALDRHVREPIVYHLRNAQGQIVQADPVQLSDEGYRIGTDYQATIWTTQQVLQAATRHAGLEEATRLLREAETAAQRLQATGEGPLDAAAANRLTQLLVELQSKIGGSSVLAPQYRELLQVSEEAVQNLLDRGVDENAAALLQQIRNCRRILDLTDPGRDPVVWGHRLLIEAEAAIRGLGADRAVDRPVYLMALVALARRQTEMGVDASSTLADLEQAADALSRTPANIPFLIEIAYLMKLHGIDVTGRLAGIRQLIETTPALPSGSSAETLRNAVSAIEFARDPVPVFDPRPQNERTLALVGSADGAGALAHRIFGAAQETVKAGNFYHALELTKRIPESVWRGAVLLALSRSALPKGSSSDIVTLYATLRTTNAIVQRYVVMRALATYSVQALDEALTIPERIGFAKALVSIWDVRGWITGVPGSLEPNRLLMARLLRSLVIGMPHLHEDLKARVEQAALALENDPLPSRWTRFLVWWGIGSLAPRRDLDDEEAQLRALLDGMTSAAELPALESGLEEATHTVQESVETFVQGGITIREYHGMVGRDEGPRPAVLITTWSGNTLLGGFQLYPDDEAKRLGFSNFYPRLPSGHGYGRTLMGLVLTARNRWAGYQLEINGTTPKGERLFQQLVEQWGGRLLLKPGFGNWHDDDGEGFYALYEIPQVSDETLKAAREVLGDAWQAYYPNDLTHLENLLARALTTLADGTQRIEALETATRAFLNAAGLEQAA